MNTYTYKAINTFINKRIHKEINKQTNKCGKMFGYINYNS